MHRQGETGRRRHFVERAIDAIADCQLLFLDKNGRAFIDEIEEVNYVHITHSHASVAHRRNFVFVFCAVNGRACWRSSKPSRQKLRDATKSFVKGSGSTQ